MVKRVSGPIIGFSLRHSELWRNDLIHEVSECLADNLIHQEEPVHNEVALKDLLEVLYPTSRYEPHVEGHRRSGGYVP